MRSLADAELSRITVSGAGDTDLDAVDSLIFLYEESGLDFFHGACERRDFRGAPG